MWRFFQSDLDGDTIFNQARVLVGTPLHCAQRLLVKRVLKRGVYFQATHKFLLWLVRCNVRLETAVMDNLWKGLVPITTLGQEFPPKDTGFKSSAT